MLPVGDVSQWRGVMFMIKVSEVSENVKYIVPSCLHGEMKWR